MTTEGRLLSATTGRKMQCRWSLSSPHFLVRAGLLRLEASPVWRSIESVIRACVAPINRADVVAIESGLPTALLHQGKHRVDRRCCDLDEATHFLDGGDECIDLHRSASFEILQHRNFVTEDGAGCVQ